MNESFKNRYVGLVILGILQVLLGGLCGLFVPLMIVVMTFAPESGQGDAMDANLMLPGLVIYLVAAVWFVWVGIGSIMARRWARALILVTSWIWLVSGICGLLYMLSFMPGLFEDMSETSAEVGRMVAAVTYGFLFVIYILVPGLFILFYGSRHVKATCEQRDPKERWTDRCPLPVLALTLCGAFGGIFMLTMGFYNWAVPFFGQVLTGVTGAGVVVVMAAVLLVVARESYRLNPVAWWTTLVLLVVWSASTIVTFTQIDFMTYYELMGMSEQQLQAMEMYPMSLERGMMAMTGGWLVLGVAYLLYVRRYFRPA